MNFEFDLQRFKSNTTVENKYEPTEDELRTQKITADTAQAYYPNITMLNSLGAQLMKV